MIRSFKNKSLLGHPQHLSSWHLGLLTPVLSTWQDPRPIPQSLVLLLLGHLWPESSVLSSSLAKSGQQSRESQSDPHMQR